MEFLSEYGLFLAKSITLLAAVLIVIIFLVGINQKGRSTDRGHLEVRSVNDNLEGITRALKQKVLDADGFKQEEKLRKKSEKSERKSRKKVAERRRRVYVLDFDGDIEASGVKQLREEVTAVLSIAEPKDEVVVRLESPGGQVHGYGLGASQLSRIVSKGIPLVVAVDKVAASGGYMMACIANRIIAAPFALLGSIGVAAQVPNFHRFLKNRDVDVEVLTAGEFKRTLTMFGENTEKGREKFQEELEDVHTLFKEYVSQHRPVVNTDLVATGEAWYGRHALEHQLVDELMTSDEYLCERAVDCDVYEIKYVEERSKLDKIMERFSLAVGKLSGRTDLKQQPYFF